MSTWLYHITSINNLASILQTGKLLSKNRLQASQTSHTSIAYEHIQDRRLTTAVPCGPGGVLHDYVPFYFAPRSPMLYAIHRGAVTSYTSGQDLLLHMLTTAEAVAAASLGFAFSDGHAVIRYTRFYDDLAYLNEAIDQEVMTARYWNDTDEDGDRRRRRQAEFLVYQEVPWHLIRAVCVKNQAIANQVKAISQQLGQTLTIRLRPQWYYD